MRYGLSFDAARETMRTARDPFKGKPLQNNTRLYERGDRCFAVRLHNTDVVEILPNGRYHISHGGWATVTTLDRIRSYSPARIESERGEWYVRCLPKSSDPEPEFPHSGVPTVFHATDPGPAPVKSGPCDAGLVSYRSEMAQVSMFEGDMLPGDRILWSYHAPALDRPTRAQNVLQYLKAGEQATSVYLSVKRLVTVRTDYVADPVHSYYTVPRRGTEAQCAHCRAHDMKTYEWQRANHLWTDYCAQIELHGSVESWAAAKTADRRRVREGRKTWREWLRRNRIPMTGNGVTVDHNGYALRRESEAYFKAERAAERRARARQRECEQREREQVQLDKFKARIWKRRGEPFEVVANRVAAELHTVKSELQSGGDAE